MIRVFIERHIKDGCLEKYKDVINKAKQSAGKVRGYVSGEMLSESKNNNTVMVLSIWTDLEAWKEWEKSTVRHNIIQALDAILEGSENIRIFK